MQDTAKEKAAILREAMNSSDQRIGVLEMMEMYQAWQDANLFDVEQFVVSDDNSVICSSTSTLSHV